MNEFLTNLVIYIALIAGVGSCIVWYVAYRMRRNANEENINSRKVS